MPLIKKRQEIDQNNFFKSLKSRNRTISNHECYKFMNEILDGKMKNHYLYQCDCGQLFTLNKKKANEILRNYSFEEIPCRKCNPEIYTEYIFDFKIYNDLDKINMLIQNYLDGEINEQNLLEKANKVNPYLLKVKTKEELFFNSFKINEEIFNSVPHIPENLNLLEQLVIKANPSISDVHTLFAIFEQYKQSFSNTLAIQTRNTQYSLLKQEAELFDRPLPIDVESKPMLTEEKINIINELSEYNHLIEEKALLDILLNLVKMAEGLAPAINPFESEKATAKNGQKLKANTLFAKILSFKNYSFGVHIFYMLEDIYKNLLRNAFSHNDYKIVKDQIEYKEDSITIDELKELNKQISELQSYIYLRLQKIQYK